MKKLITGILVSLMVIVAFTATAQAAPAATNVGVHWHGNIP
jgi:hypothetical protein